jgi:hypothetical protein
MEMWLIVLGCILLRAHYVANTVYNVRAYDWDGHIQYISYIVDHMQLPPVTLGWETTQAPLYYAIAAGALALFRSMHLLSEEFLVQ